MIFGVTLQCYSLCKFVNVMVFFVLFYCNMLVFGAAGSSCSCSSSSACSSLPFFFNSFSD